MCVWSLSRNVCTCAHFCVQYIYLWISCYPVIFIDRSQLLRLHYTKWVWANLWCATTFHCCLGIYQTLRHWCKNGPHSLKSCWIVYIWMSVCVCVCVWVRQCSQVTYLMINGFKVHSSSWKLDSLLYESQYCCTVHAVFVSMCACTYIYIHITNVL